MRRMYQILITAGLMTAAALQVMQVKLDNLHTSRLQKPMNKPKARRAGRHSATAWHLHAKGQRESLRTSRRAQGGPGIKLVNGVWQPRA